MSYSRIPAELRLLNQWCCWSYLETSDGKLTKVPYNPITGRKVDVTDHTTYCSYDSCVASVQSYSGLGFIFTSNDNYSGVDLDSGGNHDSQLTIFNSFDSYSEISPSGKGLHIIVKGVVPSGKRRDGIEVYSSGRFFTMTGNVYHDKPIAERQGLLTQLWEQLGGKVEQSLPTNNGKEIYNDQEIVEQAKRASNGDKFNQLWIGEWKSSYPSQSEADMAIVDMLAFYTQSRTQIARIFRLSALGKRAKAARSDYVVGMINKSFDRQLPTINTDGFKEALQAKLNEQKPLEVIHHTIETVKEYVSDTSRNDSQIDEHKRSEASSNNYEDRQQNNSGSGILPPGLIGEIAQYIYHSSARPVWEIALAGAIGLMAGICGKAYNANHSGLNLFVLVVADTGVGKEAPATAIGILMNEVNKQSICANEFIGPSEFASGQALLKELKDTKRQSFVSILGEFGFRLKSMCDPRANAAETKLLGTLLDMFAKSGGRAVLGANVYSDKDKSTEAIDAPSMSLLADTTPGTFYNILNEEMIDMGLLPRFLIMEYKGKRAYLNENMIKQPSNNLIGKLVSLTSSVKSFIHSKKTIDAQVTAHAYSLLKRFDVYSTDIMNDSTKGFVKHLWNRAHLKIQRLATLVAIGINPHNPLVDESCVNWAAQLITKDIEQLCAKFDGGEIGKNSYESDQMKDITRNTIEYLNWPWEKVKTYCTPSCEKMHNEHVVPMEFYERRTGKLASFRKDRLGESFALKRAVQKLVDNGKLLVIDLRKYNTARKAWKITPDLLE